MITGPTFKSKGYGFIEKVSDSTVSANDQEIDISDEMHVKKPEENDSVQNPFEDNRFIDHVNDHFMNSAAAAEAVATNYFEQQHEHFADDEPELPNKIDFAEKENYSEYMFFLCSFSRLFQLQLTFEFSKFRLNPD